MNRWVLAFLGILAVAGCNADDDGPSGTDTSAPGRVNDLQAVSTTGSSVQLTWTAPGDDGEDGTAAAYDVRYLAVTISESNWSSAARCASVPEPAAGGTSQSMAVDGLEPDTPYTFALRAADEASNWSALSNVASIRTPPVGGPNGTIVFAVSRETLPAPSHIWRIQADGSALVQLTNGEVSDCFPQWSPDGTKIAFLRRTGSYSDLFLMEQDGSDVRRLTDGAEIDNGGGDDIGYRWAPAGDRLLVFAGGVGHRPFPSWILVPTTAADPDTILPHLTTDGVAGFGNPWSPDGSEILYEGPEDRTISAISVEARTTRVVLHNAILPFWSQTGDRIYFQYPTTDDLWSAAASGADPRLCATLDPEWIIARDRSQIASADRGTWHALDLSTCSVRQICRWPEGQHPIPRCWSPDGSFVLGVLWTGTVDSLVMVDAETGTPVRFQEAPPTGLISINANCWR